jgi:hypothetical protein
VLIDKWTVSFAIFDSNPALHKPYTIHAQARSGQFQTLYWFYENKDFVWKSEAINFTAKKDYYLMYDSSFNYTVDKQAKLFHNAAEKINGEIIPFSALDSTVINEVIRVSDSLKLKNFHFLKKAIGFRLAAIASKR